MNFEESVEFMSGLLRFGWKLDNSRVEALCERFDDPHLRYPVIHITGTKGKGSTTALSAAILKAQGYRVGSYFSPYVYDLRERIQIDGEMIPKEDFARIVSQIRPVMEELATTEIGQTTEFELKTVTAFLYFAEQKVDFACIEVGIGGRLDATNIVQPLVTVITNIGLDHTEILGETHAKIAWEKAGILKNGVPCFTATENPEAFEVIQARAAQLSVPLSKVVRLPSGSKTEDATPPHNSYANSIQWRVEIDEDEDKLEAPGSETPDFANLTVVTPRRRYEDLQVRMGGLYQRENAACAIAATEEALAIRGETLREDAVRSALSATSLPGRLSITTAPSKPVIVVDGAHNGLAAERLVSPILALKKKHGISRFFLVIGMVGGHEPDDVLSRLASFADAVFTCQVDWKRAIPAEVVAEAAQKFCKNVRAFPDVKSAFETARREADEQTLLLVTGSLYLAGAITPEMLAG